YANAIKELGAQARKARAVGCSVINSALGAAAIPNVLHRSLGDINLEKVVSAEIIIDNSFPVACPEPRVSHYRKILEELERGTKHLRQVRDLAVEGLGCLEDLLVSRAEMAGFSVRKRISLIEGRLSGKSFEFATLIRIYGGSGLQHISDRDRYPAKGGDGSLQASVLFYKTYLDVSNSLVSLLEKCKQRLLSRLEEEQGPPDFAALAVQWQADQQLGRGLVWSGQPGRSIAEGSALLAEVEKSFSRKIEEIKNRYSAIRPVNQLQFNHQHLLELFNQGDIAGLRHCQQEIEKVAVVGKVRWTSCLAVAMRATDQTPGNPFRSSLESSASFTQLLSGDTLFVDCYLEPEQWQGRLLNAIILQWIVDGRRYRALWGEAKTILGDRSDLVLEMGDLPALGEWVRLKVPVDDLGLQGAMVEGFAVLIDGGLACWDAAGILPSSGNGYCWGAICADDPGTNKVGQGWDWLGTRSHEIIDCVAVFSWDAAPVEVGMDDNLFVDILLDQNCPPDRIGLRYFLGEEMVTVYWGHLDFPDAPLPVGPLPEGKQWFRLESRASLIGLAGKNVDRIELVVVNGGCWWREIGFSSSGTRSSDGAIADRGMKGDGRFLRYGNCVDMVLPVPMIELEPLIQGFLHELNGRVNEALNAYHLLLGPNVLASHVRIALRRIAALSLDADDIESSLAAYQCLAGISTVDIPLYADMLRLVGKYQEAADEYSIYMQQVPDDLGSMLKMGEIFQENLNSVEGARMAFEYVLEREPGNRQALTLLQKLESQC
ncbi:MAG: hypothetical protein L3J63_04160, partial [Geopsychrobacter sp.]|nr:hypothetical protein [Geopsychrobacter sp.]